MALSIKPASGHGLKGPLRGQKARSFQCTPDASKPAGGYTVLASALGFSFLDFGVAEQPASNVYAARFRIGTASTDATLQYYAATGSAASLVGSAIGASDTTLIANPVAIYVIGR